MRTFVIVLLGAVCVLIGALIVIVLRRRYTKAKFAFVAFSALSTLSLLVVASLLAQETPIQSIFRLVAEMRGRPTPVPGPSSLELVVICFMTFLLHNTARSIFRNWTGPITVEDRRKELQQQKAGFFGEGIREALRFLARRPAPPIYTPPNDTHHMTKITPPDDALVWHQHARELTMLRTPTLDFPQGDGWHEQEDCWVGKNIRTGETVVLGCSVERPSTERLRRFAQYIRRMAGTQDSVSTSHIWLFRSEGTSESADVEGLSVSCESESSVLDQLVDFGDYYFDLTRRVERDSLPESEVSLSDVYVESLCAHVPSDFEEAPRPVEETLRAWLDDPSSRHIALLGEYGQGKSTCALVFAHNIINSSATPANRIPILIELRGKAPSTLTPEELLATWAVRFGINPMALMKLLVAGRLLLIFDGFDEMAFIGQGDARVEHFRTIWQLAYPKAKILITGRPNFFLDEGEMRAALGLRGEIPGRPHCQALYLRHFSVEQIGVALRSFKESVRSEIQALAERNPRFRDLASRPCLLYIIGVLWERRREELSSNLNSASVIGLFVSYSLERQWAKSRAGAGWMTLSTPERLFFMQGVAAHMVASHLPNQLLVRDLRAVTSQLLAIIPETVTGPSDAMTSKSPAPLRERIGEDENLQEALFTDVRTYCILVNDPSNANAMRFAHKSFMEYLAASVVANTVVSRADDAAAAISNTFALGMATIVRERETAAFFGEVLASTIATDAEDVDAKAAPLLRTLVPSSIARRAAFPLLVRMQHLTAFARRRMLKRALDRGGERVSSDDRAALEAYLEATSLLDSHPCAGLSPYRMLLFFFAPLFLAPAISVYQERWCAWLNSCIELGVSAEAMAACAAPGQSAYFEYSRLRRSPGFPMSKAVFTYSRSNLPMLLRLISEH